MDTTIFYRLYRDESEKDCKTAAVLSISLVFSFLTFGLIEFVCILYVYKTNGSPKTIPNMNYTNYRTISQI